MVSISKTSLSLRNSPHKILTMKLKPPIIDCRNHNQLQKVLHEHLISKILFNTYRNAFFDSGEPVPGKTVQAAEVRDLIQGKPCDTPLLLSGSATDKDTNQDIRFGVENSITCQYSVALFTALLDLSDAEKFVFYKATMTTPAGKKQHMIIFESV